MNLSSFQRPSRYINSELNSYRKDFYEKRISGDVRIALCFPDTYEVGMSHLGLKILYDIINISPHASAERVFSPWTDLEEHMKRDGILLSSLESDTPLKEFDIVGFSLQYELSYTTVLNMLHLGGIPLRSEERAGSGKFVPLVIAGGPCTVNPAPMSEFIDIFLIGDGEDAMPELIDAAGRWKSGGDGKRESLIAEISRLKGFYVPMLHGKESVISRRFVHNLDNAHYPLKPIVPYTSIVHDRVNIEVSRGCTMGCRFCQAGMIYRPLRERSPENVLRIAGESLKNTGYNEVSFTSLSAGDYTHLLPVVKEFNRRFGPSRTALSLPSLRVGAVNRDVLKEIKSVRKTGFTMAPEAATERLRGVINKDFSGEDYERALRALFEEGWLSLKLYFMIGLPTETDEDIEAIRSMAMKALHTAKKNTGRFVNISITVSPFVPKSHTPFQWCGQISLDEIKRKQKYLRAALGEKKFKYKGHNEEMTFLEAVFARGDERLSLLIEKAWEAGCRLDGWSETFDFNKWLVAMDKTGIDGFAYARRVFDKNERLPWDNIGVGIKKDFLLREYENATACSMTVDCRKVCTACGLKCGSESGVRSSEFGIVELESFDSKLETQNSKLVRIRVQFSKTGRLRYLSHLELVAAVLRGLRRASVPVDFSKGFHPSPKVSFGPPLNVGIAGEKEYFDMEVFSPFDIEFYMEAINNTMPDGIKIGRMEVISKDAASLNSFIKRYEYRVKGERLTANGMEENKITSLIVRRDGKDTDIAPCVEHVSFDGEDNSARLVIADTDAVKARVGEVSEAVFGTKMTELELTRTALYGMNEKGWIEPL
ncbi:MAG TPA: TIGR03960 family B12-binding radical SAM protein [Nitrospiraceae bacterium]|nr:TIGR03960 family radical SAM protein [Nitrospiraceae bacterium]HCZ12088.1 TIGR03960 family B12-binding radical SAM protein [Nitrospiraceae bacterium]